MPKLDSALIQAFGKAVKRERSVQGLNQNECGVAAEMISRLEHGKGTLSPKTVGKIVKALTMDQDWVDRFLDASEVGDEERAEGLLGLAKADQLSQETSEEMLRTLAFEAAIDAGDDLGAAFQGLLAQLQGFKDMKAEALAGGNKEPELTALRQRVIVLNTDMDRDGAQAEIQSDILKADKTHHQQQIERYNLAVTQAQLQNDPDLAARMIVQRLDFEARPEGLFNAVVDESNALTKAHAGQASRFFDRVKLALAQGNLKRAKGPNKGWAYYNLAINQRILGHQEQGIARLKEAITSSKAAITIAEKSNMMTLRARALAELSDCLQMIWDRTGGVPDPQMIKAARTAHRLILLASDAEAKDRALVTRSLALGLSVLGQAQAQADSTILDESLNRYEEAMGYFTDWGNDGVSNVLVTNHDIALAHLRRGRLTKSMADLQAAAVGFQARSEETKYAQPYDWAVVQWNLADLAVAKWEVSDDAKYLPQAQGHLDDARATFEQGLSEFQLNKCDELQGQIDAARG